MKILQRISQLPPITVCARRLFFALLVLAMPEQAFAHTGHTVWGAWSFDWEVKDNAGIAIRNLYFNNELVLYKASIPVIRVKYGFDSRGKTCGPFADQINWEKLLNISNCGNQKVCQKSYTSNGRNWLELGVLAGIGKYQIYQVWLLSHDGDISARMFSRGLHCSIDHDHHPYWRVDADIGSASPNQIFVFDNDRPDEGWGPGWHKYPQELDELKNGATNRRWFVRNAGTGHGLSVFPGPDGIADDFSRIDMAPRRYHDNEDGPWHRHADAPIELDYNDNENIEEADVLFWYIAHLHHEAAGGPDQWHWVGPLFRIHQ